MGRVGSDRRSRAPPSRDLLPLRYLAQGDGTTSPPALDTLLPEGTRIQARPAEDLKELREQEYHLIREYGWVDRQARIARIPVDRAMRLLLERGLPARQQDPASAPAPAAPAPTDVPPQACTTSGTCACATGAWSGALRAKSGAKRAAPIVAGSGVACLAALIFCTAVSAQPGYPTSSGRAGLPASVMPAPLKEVGFDQRLGSQVPLDLTFDDETGQQVRLGQSFGEKPVVLALVYCRVPDALHPDPERGGRQPESGLARRGEGLHRRGRELRSDGDTRDGGGEEADVRRALRSSRFGARLALPHWRRGLDPRADRAVGFSYKWDDASGQFAHPAGITVLTPDGRGGALPVRDRIRSPGLAVRAHRSVRQTAVGTPIDTVMLHCYPVRPRKRDVRVDHDASDPAGGYGHRARPRRVHLHHVAS